ncbi:MAG: hypothetical protein R8K49_06155 [Mariprofundaceae bacterium]
MNQWLIILMTLSLCSFSTSLQAGSVQTVKGLPQVDVAHSVKVNSSDVQEVSLQELIERLKATDAIGFFTKLAIRSDVLDFKSYVRDLRRKKILECEIETVRSNFNGLVLKIIALLEKDPGLSKIIYLARESIFKSIMEVSV